VYAQLATRLANPRRYNKSELIPINLDESEKTFLNDIFGYEVGNFSIQYLGVPLYYEKLKREDIQPQVDKILKRMAG
jgi:hypothetical protein